MPDLGDEADEVGPGEGLDPAAEVGQVRPGVDFMKPFWQKFTEKT
jgi:hypothetical protein